MKNFIEILESITSPFPYNINIGASRVIAKWEVPGTDKKSTMGYSFEAEKGEMADLDIGKSWEIDFAASRNVKFGITGTGSAFRIFATVLEIMKKFIKTKNPNMFHFSASEPSRIKLYDKFAKRFKKLAKYYFTKFQGDYETVYVFHKELNDFKNVSLRSGFKKLTKK